MVHYDDDDDDKDAFGDIVGISEDLVSARDQKIAGTSSLGFDGLLKVPLLLYEDVKPGCGGQLWPAGMVLAKYLLREPHLTELRGKRILELGAGGGLVGLALAVALTDTTRSTREVSSTVHMTDQAPMLPLMRRNIALNHLDEDRITASILDWGTTSEQPNEPPDVLIAAECVYFEPAFPLLLQTLQELIGEHTICYFCFKKRRKADLRFMKEARKLFKVEDVRDDPDKHVWSRENLFMYKITRRIRVTQT